VSQIPPNLFYVACSTTEGLQPRHSMLLYNATSTSSPRTLPAIKVSTTATTILPLGRQPQKAALGLLNPWYRNYRLGRPHPFSSDKLGWGNHCHISRLLRQAMAGCGSIHRRYHTPASHPSSHPSFASRRQRRQKLLGDASVLGSRLLKRRSIFPGLERPQGHPGPANRCTGGSHTVCGVSPLLPRHMSMGSWC